MSKTINTNYSVSVRKPLDGRLTVETAGGLSSIAFPYVGLRTFVADENRFYLYDNTGAWVQEATSTTWGSIGGSIGDQLDLTAALLSKYDKTGGLISGFVEVSDVVQAVNFITTGFGTTPPPPGTTITWGVVSASTDIDWSAGNLFILDPLLGSLALTESSLPAINTAQNIKILALTAGFSLILPVGWVPTSNAEVLSPTKINIIDVTTVNNAGIATTFYTNTTI